MLNKKTYVVGIAGGSASGKTTLTEKLAKRLDAFSIKVFHMDAYFKETKMRPQSVAPITGKVYIDDNHPLTMNLSKLAEDIRLARASEDYQVILVEGLLTLWCEEILEQLDLKLFLDCRADERIVRRIKRNMQWNQTLEEITSVYLDLVRYRHDEYVEPSRWRADLVLNGSCSSDVVLDMIEDQIRKNIIKGQT